MGTVTAYDMGSIQAALGGANPISLSEYYRGGAYVPTTRSTTTRDPASGQLFNPYYTGIGYTVWSASGANIQNPYTGPTIYIYWKRPAPPQTAYLSGSYVSSYTSGATTYYRGSLISTAYDPYGAGGGSSYYIYTTVSGTTSINTGVPSSGSIAISQLYGAANP